MNKDKIIDFYFDSKYFTYKKTDRMWDVHLPAQINNCKMVEIASFSAPFFTSQTNGYNQLFELPAENEEIHFIYGDQNDNPIDLNLSIPQGQYTMSQILTLLNSQIAATLGSLGTLTLGINGSNYITFSVTTSQTFGYFLLKDYTFLSDLLQLSSPKIYYTFGSTQSTSVTSLLNRTYTRWYTLNTLHYYINDNLSYPYLFTPSSDTLTYLQWGSELVEHIKASATARGIDFSGMTWTYSGGKFILSSTTGDGNEVRWSPEFKNDDYTESSILYYINIPRNQRKGFPTGQFSATPVVPYIYRISVINTILGQMLYKSTTSANLSLTSAPYNFLSAWSFTAGMTYATVAPTILSKLSVHGYSFTLDTVATSTNGEPATTFTLGRGSLNMAYLNISGTSNLSYIIGSWSGVVVSYGNTSYARTSDNPVTFDVTNYNTVLYLCSSLCDSLYLGNDYSRIMLNILYGDANGNMILPFMPENIRFTPNSRNIQSFSVFVKDKNFASVDLFGQPIHIHFRFYCEE